MLLFSIEFLPLFTAGAFLSSERNDSEESDKSNGKENFLFEYLISFSRFGLSLSAHASIL